ncbi:MAG TPA: MtnX-like HAD-IB family phosphatase [candidate division Zixibacteria bacterium]|nr:MtnX-like HAD-IB family phosphatase [candidate division Zixibacteria bacterium]
MANLMNLVVLCDFDGTITTIDTAEWVLARFAQGDWRAFDRQFEKGEIAIEECLNSQFSLVRASKKQILKELKDIVVFRSNFKKLAEYCKENHVPLMIVSAGLDFVIEHFLELNHCSDLAKVCAAKTSFGGNGIKFTFPTLLDRTSDNIKDDVVRRCKSHNQKVIYVGDGLADYAAARNSGYSFAIEGSRLARLCRKNGIPCRTITDFQEIIEALRKIHAGQRASL